MRKIVLYILHLKNPIKILSFLDIAVEEEFCKI